MKVLGKLMDHVRLVARMAKATDTDLVGASGAGDLSQEDWAEIVQTCRRCTWAEDCGPWLDRTGKAACAPDTCLNRDRFAALKAQAKARETEAA